MTDWGGGRPQPGDAWQPGDLIEVEWWDSERVTIGWASADEYRAALEDRSLYRTAGYFVAETSHGIMVSHSRSDSGNFSDAMVIPKTAIENVAALHHKDGAS